MENKIINKHPKNGKPTKIQTPLLDANGFASSADNQSEDDSINETLKCGYGRYA
jgi:hypothetical protein